MLQLFYSVAEIITPAVEQVASAPPSLFITIVASAFGGALITSGVTIWAKFADSKAEHRKWLREEKFKTYVDAQIIFQGLQSKEHLAGLLKQDSTGLITRTHSAFSRIDLLAPLHVRAAVGDARSKLTSHDDDAQVKAFKSAISKLLVEMRKDLSNDKSKKVSG